MIKKHNRNLSTTLDGTFQPINLICRGKTVQSLPKFDFPEDLSLFTFLKHYSNTAESIKLIEEITFYRWISMYYIFPTRASVFFMSLTKLGGKKMWISRRERCFYSNYFIPKCNENVMKIFVSQKLDRRV